MNEFGVSIKPPDSMSFFDLTIYLENIDGNE